MDFDYRIKELYDKTTLEFSGYDIFKEQTNSDKAKIIQYGAFVSKTGIIDFD